MKRSIVFTLLILLVLSISIMSGPGCANIVPPSGGPRDSLPPVLLRVEPGDSTLNFKSNRITFTFDEFVDVQDVSNNLLFTPTFNTNPRVEVRLRTITVRLRDTLDPNTTYTFNFGNAIVDINEGNALRDFVYTFSTGPVLDSLELSGKVVMAETGKIDTTLVVLLHKKLTDSAVVKERPRYVAKLASDGSFRFRNLPSGVFAVYALGNAGLVRRYMSKTQDFAFADSPVVAGSATKPLTLYAYKEAATTTTTTTATSPSTRGRSSGGENRLRFTSSVADGTQDLLRDLVINFDQPLRNLDSTKMALSTDSTFISAPYSFTLDSTKKKLTIQTPWKENTLYNLIVDRDFAEDTLKRKLLKTDTLSFTTHKRSEYGTLNIRLKNADKNLNPVLQFVQNEAIVFAASIKNGTINQPLFLPGEYELRILYDTNDNGIWNSGQFFGTKRQPEIVQPLQRKITVKSAWNNDFEVTAPGGK